jgi:hypothetical protein
MKIKNKIRHGDIGNLCRHPWGGSHVYRQKVSVKFKACHPLPTKKAKFDAGSF